MVLLRSSSNKVRVRFRYNECFRQFLCFFCVDPCLEFSQSLTILGIEYLVIELTSIADDEQLLMGVVDVEPHNFVAQADVVAVAVIVTAIVIVIVIVIVTVVVPDGVGDMSVLWLMCGGFFL